MERMLTERDFARLLASVDCYVSPHLREGFGLIPLQALACGTRVVATNYDGPATYLNATNAILVEPRGTFSPTCKHACPEDEWAVLDAEDLAAGLRQAYDEVQERRDTARRFGLNTARSLSWEASAKALVASVEKHVGEVRRRHIRARCSAPRTASVLAPCRDGQADLDRFLASLCAEPWPGAELEVIIFDDTSEVPLTLTGLAPAGTRIIRSDAWVGEMAGRDRLLREASGEFVFCTDADVEFYPGWLEPLLAAAKRKPLTIWHPLMLLPGGKVWSAGGCYKNYSGTALPAWHHLMGATINEEEIAAIAKLPLTYAPGAGWFGNREEILRRWQWTGGYFPTVFGDVDAAFWLRSHGMQFKLLPEVRLTHHHGSYTQQQTETEEQRERFSEHAAEFLAQWGDVVADDIKRGAYVAP
jgi:GT2 family glycosyltransferase